MRQASSAAKSRSASRKMLTASAAGSSRPSRSQAAARTGTAATTRTGTAPTAKSANRTRPRRQAPVNACPAPGTIIERSPATARLATGGSSALTGGTSGMRDAGTVAVPSALQRTGPVCAALQAETPALEREERKRRDGQQRETPAHPSSGCPRGGVIGRVRLSGAAPRRPESTSWGHWFEPRIAHLGKPRSGGRLSPPSLRSLSDAASLVVVLLVVVVPLAGSVGFAHKWNSQVGGDCDRGGRGRITE